MPPNNADVIRALKLAGFAAQKRIEYATAMAHLREAAGLTNREREPGQWAEIQHAIADVLIDQGQYRQAATVLKAQSRRATPLLARNILILCAAAIGWHMRCGDRGDIRKPKSSSAS